VATPPAQSTRRSEHSRGAILDAAWELFGRIGLRELSIEAIAKAAGVGKTTIYRWWPSKSAVVLDALERHFRAAIPFPDTGSVAQDLRKQMRSAATMLQSPIGSAYLALVAEGQHDPDLARALIERIIAPRRGEARDVLVRGIERGDLAADLDPDLVVDLLYGPIYYRMLVTRAPLTRKYIDSLLAAALPTTG
jgi:AcrR family transcriptional regulator